MSRVQQLAQLSEGLFLWQKDRRHLLKRSRTDFSLPKLKVCFGEERTKTGTQSVQSQQGYMWSFNQKDVVSEAFLENTPYRTSPRVWPGVSVLPLGIRNPRNQGAWPALMVPSHGITAVRLEKPSKAMKPKHQAGSSTVSSTGPGPLCHSHVLWTLPGWWLPTPLGSLCQAWQPWHNLQRIFIQSKPPMGQHEAFPQELPEEVSHTFLSNSIAGLWVWFNQEEKCKIKTTIFSLKNKKETKPLLLIPSF